MNHVLRVRLGGLHVLSLTHKPSVVRNEVSPSSIPGAQVTNLAITTPGNCSLPVLLLVPSQLVSPP